MRKPGRARQFYMPTMPPDRSRRKWVWNMPSKPPSKMALRAGEISWMGHSGAISYFVQQAARAGLIGISMCQSDPMVVPFGGAEIYYGTNPLAFAAPGEGDEILTFDMATTVQAWKRSTPARVICLSRIPGRSIKTVHQHGDLFAICSAPRSRAERVWPDDDDLRPLRRLTRLTVRATG